MSLILNLLVLLLGAKVMGEIAERVGLPSVLGYIFTGILAGPMILDFVAPVEIHLFAEMGILLLLFITGFEQGNIRELLKNLEPIMSVSLLGFVFPYVTAFLIGLFFGYSLDQLLLLGLLVAATDSGITIKSIASVGKLGTRAGKVMLGVTVVDGTVGLIIFTAIISYVTLGTLGVVEIAGVVLMLLLFLAIFLIMQKGVPQLVGLIEHLTVEEAEFSFAFILMILIALMAETFGLHGIIGAFLAGTILAKSPLRASSFIKKMNSISYAIFIPLFFVWSGLLLKLEYVNLMSFMIVGGVLISNAVAAYIAGMLNGLSRDDCMLMSISMLPRGDINLVMAAIAVTLVGAGGQLVLPAEVGQLFYSTVMLLIIMAALIAFALLRIFVKKEES